MKSFQVFAHNIIPRIKPPSKGRPQYPSETVLSSYRQAPNPHTRLLEYNRAPLGKGVLNIGKIRKQQTHLLFRTTLRSASEEDHGRLSRFA